MIRDEILDAFIAYCRAHPNERFWQALRNWSGHNFILVSERNDGDTRDTFYWNDLDAPIRPRADSINHSSPDTERK